MTAVLQSKEINFNQILKRYEIDSATLLNWMGDGLPYEKRNNSTLFDEKDVILWIRRRHPKQLAKQHNKQESIARKEAARAELIEIEVALARKQVVYVEEFVAEMADQIMRAKTKILGIPTRYRSVLQIHNMPEDQIDLAKDALENLLREALQELSNGKE